MSVFATWTFHQFVAEEMFVTAEGTDASCATTAQLAKMMRNVAASFILGQYYVLTIKHNICLDTIVNGSAQKYFTRKEGLRRRRWLGLARDFCSRE
jgi:predicted secreted protein